MNELISISLLLFFLGMGINYPRQSGWLAIIICPILGPTSLTLSSSDIIPLTVYRIFAAITFGIIISRYKRNYTIFDIFKSTYLKSS